MLTFINIRNLAIIDTLEIELPPGFTVITGETGAGKSVLISAIQLLLGGRASIDQIRHGEDRALVEGTLVLSDERRRHLTPLLKKSGLSVEDELILRRVIDRKSGRSRAFVNGSVVGLNTMRQLTQGLIDISGQHEHYTLLDPDMHLTLLDHFGGLRHEAERLSLDIQRLSALQGEVRRLKRSERERLTRLDYLNFQIRTLDTHLLSTTEHQALEDEATLLRHAQLLRRETQSLSHTLGEGLADALGDVTHSLERLVRFDARLESITTLIEQAHIQLDEAALELRQYHRNLVTDPDRLEQIDERINQHRNLERKYGEDYEQTLLQLEAMREERSRLEGADARIEAAEQEHRILLDDVMERARALSRARIKAAQRLVDAVEHGLRDLGMARCRFAVELTQRDGRGEPTTDLDATTDASLNERGLDAAEFTLCPNPGEGFKPMAKIASGGELSRILLAIKGGLMATDPVSTYIFDEIDTGIGGGVGVAVGETIKAIAATKQVISITHLPQIASFAHHHLKVAKVSTAKRTSSVVTPLDNSARVVEIARMLGGLPATPKTLEHAREMLTRAHPSRTFPMPSNRLQRVA